MTERGPSPRLARLALGLARLARGLAPLVWAGSLGACTEMPCPPADLAPLPEEARFAIVSSDYASTAIGVLDREGALVTEAFVDSGSVPPGIVAALSGDVVLPGAPLGVCTLAVVDRYGTDALTLFDACAGGARAQLDVGAGFRSNPQDVLSIGEGLALVSRHELNGDPDAPASERGNDLLLVALDPPRVMGRVDLAPLDAGEALARPARLARLERWDVARVVIGLARLSRDFMAPGPGAVGVLDPESGALDALELAPLTSCEDVDPVPGEPYRAIVRCAGRPFTDEVGRRGSAGLVLVDLGEAGALAEIARWSASDHPDEPVYDASAVPLGGTRVAVTAKGDLVAGVPDRVAILDLATGEASPLFEAGSAFVIGDGAFEDGLLLLPDAHAGVVRRFAIEGDAATELAPTPTAPCRGLPPREVRRFAR